MGAIVAEAVPGPLRPGQVVRVLDPACGDGRFLAAAAGRIDALGATARLTGIDVDAPALAAARDTCPPGTRLHHGDALARDWGDERFDVVVGNPPFLNALSRRNRADGRARVGGGPYAGTDAEFLALAMRLAEPCAARVGLVLPVSVLSTRDAGVVRDEVDRTAALRWAWWSPVPVFEAKVRTCAMVWETGGRPGPVRRAFGPGVTPRPDVAAMARWCDIVAGDGAVPDPGLLHSDALLGDRARASAGFRDQYYGMAEALVDDVAPVGPRLVTVGAIDPGVCRWGERPATSHGARRLHPRVRLDALGPWMTAWAARHLVPKVLVATQSTVIEAVADPTGDWLPGVPVVSVVPSDRAQLWQVAAVLTNPVTSAWVARRAAGSGLSGATVRVSAAALNALPWPCGDVGPAADALRAGEVVACGGLVASAYGAADVEALMEWWTPLVLARLSGATARSATPRRAR